MAIHSLSKEAKKVDADFSVQPLEENDDGLVYYDPTDVPLNHTDLQANIMISERSSFEKQKPWGKGAEEVDDEDMQNPVVDFSFVFSCNKEPEKVIGRIKQKWKKGGGNVSTSKNFAHMRQRELSSCTSCTIKARKLL